MFSSKLHFTTSPQGPQVKHVFHKATIYLLPTLSTSYFIMLSTKFYPATSPGGPQVKTGPPQSYHRLPPHIAHNLLYHVFHKVVSGHLPTWTTRKNIFSTKLQFTTSPHCPQPFLPCFLQKCIWHPPPMDHKWKDIFHNVTIYNLPTLPTTCCTVFSTRLYPATSPHGPQTKHVFHRATIYNIPT